MAQGKLRRRSWLAASAGTIAIAGTALTLAAFGAGASASTTTHHQARPHAVAQRNEASAASASHPVTAMTQEFGTNTTPFCPAGSGNALCDGAAGDYGTIDRVPSGFSNGGVGNYAPSTKALVGSWMALVSGATDVNQGMGCPGTSNEQCSGPYALFGTGAAQGNENVFPAHGFTVTNDLYLSPSTASTSTTPASQIDDDVELNASTSNSTTFYFGIDNVITACPVSGGFAINFSNGSAGPCSGADTPVVTTDGWYRFVFAFSDNGGNAYLTASVRSEPGAKVVASFAGLVGGGAGTPISSWGGPGYFWLPTENISGVPLANLAVQLGVEAAGHKP
jgi:hypothetical protein